MGIPHFLVIPYPVLGHVNPLMQLSEALTKHGCKITFLNTEFSHKRANNAGAELDNLKESGIKFVTLPDGLEPEDDRSDHEKVFLSIQSNMPSLLPKLIEDINALDAENSITCIVATMNMCWALEVGHKLGIEGAFLWTASATSLAACYCIPRLIDDGIIDSEGVATKKQEFQLSLNMPMMDPADLPWGGLGHMNPLLQFSQVLANHGCKITFLITEFNQKRMKSEIDHLGAQIKFVTLPDGLDPEDDRSDQPKVILSLRNTMPTKLHRLIQDINNNNNALDGDNNKITCLVVSKNIGWALEVAHKLGIKGALLWPASATSLASFESIPRLIDEGIIDSETGLPTRKQEIQLLPNSPMMDTANLPWCSLGKNFFLHMVEDTQSLKLGEWWLCNTTCDLEPGALAMWPRFLSIGPLMQSDTNKSSFWREDTTCLHWLDQHPPQSVVYVSFGSLAIVEPNQFNELAIGLDLLNKPFLWVVRPSNENNKVNNTYPNEFHGSKGKIIGWAPQKKILNHPAIACFITHCGWNSIIEGVCGGIPFLCWPFFSDQFINKSYICDVWKVGLGLDQDENGLIMKGEIRKKVEQLLGNEDIKARSVKLKELTVNNFDEGGQSSQNIEKFINWAKD